MSENGPWRVTLRLTKPDDAGAVNMWLAEAVAAVDGRPATQSAAPTLTDFLGGLSRAQEALTVVDGVDAPLGLLVLGHRAEAVSTVDWLAVEAGCRNLGFGAEAIFALEDRVPNDALIGRVPAANGLAIYFWLRVGYRPIFPRPRDEEFSTEFLWMTRHASAKVEI